MNAKIALHELESLDATARAALLRRAEADLSWHMERAKPIIAAVETEGDEALARFATEFDGAAIGPDEILVSPQEFAQAESQLEEQLVATLAFAAGNIRAYHELQLPEREWMRVLSPGVHAGERIIPLASAACYTPRGKGSFPSVTLMTTIPAVVAGVGEVVVLTPPGQDGKVDPATLVAARLAGVSKVVKAGGAQAVAAAAFGTQSVPRCDKFEGPGSLWLMAAKRLLADKITSRLPAGPSESIVLADSSANANLAALDLVIESEHGPDSSTFLVTWDREIARRVRDAIPRCWDKMGSRCRSHSEQVLGGKRGGIVLATSATHAYDFINDYAPEHLQIMSVDPEEHLPHIRNAAEILLGEHTPGSVANYLLGPNCVLPTAGTARVHSPLGVHDFVKRVTVAKLEPNGYASLAEHVHRFASYEGFDAHANSVSKIRDEMRQDSNRLGSGTAK